ncbi:hypothetical protein [Schlesneria sp. DSM 10557]|uniref:hypothetical protein n=1 Tax=Schlesneria sp. DSM 10557 TaxID=3044399 RepID=UPI0035A06DEC
MTSYETFLRHCLDVQTSLQTYGFPVCFTTITSNLRALQRGQGQFLLILGAVVAGALWLARFLWRHADDVRDDRVRPNPRAAMYWFTHWMTVRLLDWHLKRDRRLLELYSMLPVPRALAKKEREDASTFGMTRPS